MREISILGPEWPSNRSSPLTTDWPGQDGLLQQFAPHETPGHHQPSVRSSRAAAADSVSLPSHDITDMIELLSNLLIYLCVFIRNVYLISILRIYSVMFISKHNDEKLIA